MCLFETSKELITEIYKKFIIIWSQLLQCQLALIAM